MARDPFEALPVNAVTRILELLSTADLYSRVSLVCKAWQCLANAAQRDTKLDVTLSSSAAGHSFAAWLSQQDGTLVRLSIHGGPLVILSPRTAMWAALSAAAQQPSGNRAGGCSSSRYRACSSTERAVGVGSASGHSSNTSRSGLQGLDVSVPLSSADEVMLLGCVARQVRSLHMLHLNYTQPSQQLCFETTAAGAALKSATQLQSLSILGAALDSSVPALARLTQLTLLAFTASGAPGLPGVLSRLVLLRHLALTSQARPGAAREGFTAALSTSIAKCSSLTTLQLVGFKATDSSNGLLSRIASLVQLQSLDLAGCLFHVQQLLPVSACTLLTSISFASNDLGGSSGSSILAQLTLPILQLRALDISGCRAQLQPLYGLTGLTSVHAGAHRFRFHPNLVATADLFGISALKQNLQALDLSCNKLDCSSLQHLAHLLGLTALNLAENDLSFEETTCEERAREVQRGACSCNAIHESTEGRNSSQRNCSSNNACVLHCNSCSKHPSGLQHLAGMRKLQQLDLSSCSLEDVTPLAHLRGSLTQLKLGFSGVWRHSYNQLLPGSFIALASLTGERWKEGVLNRMPRACIGCVQLQHKVLCWHAALSAVVAYYCPCHNKSMHHMRCSLKRVVTAPGGPLARCLDPVTFLLWVMMHLTLHRPALYPCASHRCFSASQAIQLATRRSPVSSIMCN